MILKLVLKFSFHFDGIVGEREVQFRRCVAALSGLLEGCGISKSAVDIQRVRSGGTTQFQEHFAPIAHFINVSNGLCTKIKELSLPKKSVEVTTFIQCSH